METALAFTRSPGNQVQPGLAAARRAVRILFFLNGALFATWAARVPAVQAAHGLTNATLGLALFSIACGAMVAMPIAGSLTARFGSDQVCRLSAILYAAMLPAIILTPTMATFIPVLFCFGAGHAALDVAMNAQAVLIERRYREPIMSSFHALWSMGGIVGSTLSGVLAAHGLKPLTHFALTAVLFSVALALVFPHLLEAPEERRVQPAAPNQSLKLLFSSRRLLVLGIVALCVMLGEGAMADWSAVYLRNNTGTSESLAAVGYATFSIAMTTGRFLGDYLTSRFSPVHLVRAGGVLSAAGLLLGLTLSHTAACFAGFALVGAGFATIVPIVFTAAGNIPGMVPGVALASVSSLGYLGFLIGPPAIGFMAELLGLRAALGLIVATSLTATLLASAVAKVKSCREG